MNYADAFPLWQKALNLLRDSMNETRYRTWFENLKLHSAEDGRIVIYCDDAFIVRNIRERYKTQLSMVIGQAFGEAYNLEVVTADELPRFEKEMTSSPLNPKYIFETFVVGSGNQLAYSASVAVAEDPGIAYNPLFIYGGVGLGKTHLMNAIAHYIVETKPNSKILFTTSENFTNEVVEAISRKKTLELRSRMRSVDVLLIDDVQFLSNKQATQEEFFHTFNALFENGKQIVLSSDRPPREIATLEERMSSRFMSGLVVDVQKPDYETRVAILKRMTEANHINIGAGAISYIAEQIDSNIRELEGSLIRVNALAQLEGAPITEELAQRALKTIIKKEKTAISPEKIMDEVAARYSIRRDDILSQRRNRDIAVPRQLAIYLTRELAKLSTTRIGIAFGRDHSTIMHACRKTAESIAADKEFARIVDEITCAIMEK